MILSRSARRQSASCGGIGTSEQQAEIVDPRFRHREQRLEDQVQQQVVAAQVDDEGDARLDLRDIGEVLVGTHADIRAAGEARIAQGRHDVQIRPLVRDEVVGVEIAAGLGQLRDALREGRRCLDVPDAGGAGQQEPGHDDAEEDADGTNASHVSIHDLRSSFRRASSTQAERRILKSSLRLR